MESLPAPFLLLEQYTQGMVQAAFTAKRPSFLEPFYEFFIILRLTYGSIRIIIQLQEPLPNIERNANMTIQEMKERKRALGYSNAMIAKLSGVPLGTVQKIFGGATASPRYETLRALEQVLKEDRIPSLSRPSATGASSVGESIVPYFAKKQGEYTVEDYYNLPEDKRFELIDGVLYDMTAPNSPHQLIGGYIYAQLFNHITSKKGACLPMISPLDVQLDCDDKTMVQPDVIIVCGRDKVIRRCVYGAPDFVLEVLSPSTKKKDMVIKLYKYMNAGVREYWMIDPDRKKVMIYDFEHDNYPVIMGFDAVVPVAVLDGQCKIDFRALYDYIRFLYEKSGSI